MTASNLFNIKLSQPKIVMTRFGEKTVQSGETTEAFWAAWRADKDGLKQQGWGVSKKNNGTWEASLWSGIASREQRDVVAAASRAQEIDPNIKIDIPAGLSLLPYQHAGVAFALGRDGTLLADEMGLGKTIQAIAAANTTKVSRVLIVCPASLKLNWRREISKWQTLGLPVYVVNAGVHLDVSGNGWYVINYDIAGRYEELLKRTEWDLLILDEAHYLKNSKAKRTKAILGGGREKVKAIPAKRRLILTGTPITNRPAEIFTLIHALDPARWPSFFSYAKRYCDGHQTRFGFDASGASNLDELQARLRETVMVRRLKKDVLTDLPAKRRQVITLQIEDEATSKLVTREVEFYEENEAKIAAATAAVLRAETDGTDEEYKAAVAALKEAEAALFTEMSNIRHEVALAKLPSVLEHLDNAGDKCVVFAHHRDVIAQIVAKLTEAGNKVVSITGDTKQEDRDAAVQAFQNDASVRFFVGNMIAAGVGLTLTASSHVVFAELDWVPGTLSQAEDRCHRIGQKDSVLVQHIVLDGSLDAKLAQTIIDKQEVIEQALDRTTTADVSEKAYTAPVVPARQHAEQKALDISLIERRAKLDAVAKALKPEQVQAIHLALRTVASYDADRARNLNGAGFSKLDTNYGCGLAEQNSLSPRQAAGAMKMVRKYRRQYSPELYTQIFGEEA